MFLRAPHGASLSPNVVQKAFCKFLEYSRIMSLSHVRLYHDILPREPKWCREPFSNTVRPVLSGEPGGMAY